MGWHGFKKRAGWPLSHVTVLFETYPSFSHGMCVLLVQDELDYRSVLKLSNINSWRAGIGRSLSRESTPVKDNVCQCVTKQHKHSYSILPSVGFVIWGGGSRYFGMCIQPEERRSVVFLFIRKMNNKKEQLVNTEGTAEVTYSHTSVPSANYWLNLRLIKNNSTPATGIQID